MVTFAQRVVRRIKKILDLEERHRFYLVKAAPLPDRTFFGPNGHELYASAFNPEWFAELGVVPSTIVDVGSFDGGDALRLQNALPMAKVITIEADPDRANLVREALHGTSIEVIECAVLEKDRDAKFFRTAIDGVASSQGSLYKFDDTSKVELAHIEQQETPLIVRGRTIAGLLRERGIEAVSLLHMDIQGAEYDALKGLGAARPRLIYLEVDAHYHGIKGSGDIDAMLRGWGYKLAADFVSDRLYFRPLPSMSNQFAG